MADVACRRSMEEELTPLDFTGLPSVHDFFPTASPRCAPSPRFAMSPRVPAVATDAGLSSLNVLDFGPAAASAALTSTQDTVPNMWSPFATAANTPRHGLAVPAASAPAPAQSLSPRLLPYASQPAPLSPTVQAAQQEPPVSQSTDSLAQIDSAIAEPSPSEIMHHALLASVAAETPPSLAINVFGPRPASSSESMPVVSSAPVGTTPEMSSVAHVVQAHAQPQRQGVGPRASSSAALGRPPLTPEEKAAERRRKNRESSARCYYNRKRQIEALERTLTSQKRRAVALYARELELRHENARLKRCIVLANGRLPPRNGPAQQHQSNCTG